MRSGVVGMGAQRRLTAVRPLGSADNHVAKEPAMPRSPLTVESPEKPPLELSQGTPTGKIFLANIGVNASHHFASPLRPDGAFTLVTIPEDRALAGTTLVRYGDRPDLRDVVPQDYWTVSTHYDPEFQ